MPASPIRKLVPYAEEAKKRGVKVIHLNIGQPDIKTPIMALEAIKNSDLEILAYSRTEGSEEYRKKLCQYYHQNQIEVEAADIVVTTGGSEALSFAIGAIADEDEEIIIPEPFYANYNGFSTANGVKVVPVTSKFEDNFKLPPVTEIEKKITKKTKAILLCNPGNPTGYLYEKSELEQIAQLALQHDLFIIADEVYREFAYDEKQHYSILSFNTLNQHAIMIDSVSKRYSMCGARVGCVVSKNKAVMGAILKFAQARLSPPTLAQIAAEKALETPESYFQEVKKAYVERRNYIVKALSEIDGVKVAYPSGAFYCIAELPVANAEDFCQWLLSSFSIDNETVMFAPAAGFYASNNHGINQIRIAYVLEIPALERAVNILKQALEQYNRF